MVWRAFLELVLPAVPPGAVRSRLRRALSLSDVTPVAGAVAVLGNGTGISAQDTVPFALWCAARHLDDYEAALWLTVSGLGDRDTTCAIAGGVVGAHVGAEGIPAAWRRAREALPACALPRRTSVPLDGSCGYQWHTRLPCLRLGTAGASRRTTSACVRPARR